MPEDGTADNKQQDKEGEATLFDYSWVVRPCEVYKEEYSDCTSIGARFHQYFVHGTTTDCAQWKVDYNDCMAWRNKKDNAALEKVIRSEVVRRSERLKPHVTNDVWENRESPPADWNKPLPEWLQKSNEGTYLHFKAKEMKEKKEHTPSESNSPCVLM